MISRLLITSKVAEIQARHNTLPALITESSSLGK